MAPTASASAVPPTLKKIKVFLSRASELDRDSGNPESRVAAYNCRQYAVLSGIPLAGGDAPSKSFLGALLDGLEGEKVVMASFSKEEHWKICRKVADRVFERADAEDRAGAATKGTARTFYAAGTFYEILQQFYDEDKGDVEADVSEEVRERMDEEEQRRVYCKWKATEILNAIKEGRTPAPGGYQEREDAEVEAAVDAALGGGGGGGGGLAPVDEGLAPVDEGPPPAPSPPRAPSPPPEPMGGDAPPPYDGFELSLNGRPTPTAEDANEGEDSGDEAFIPGAVKNAAADDANDVFVGAPSPAPTPAAPPPSYSSMAAIPPPASTRPLPPPTAEPSSPSGGGMFSSLFGHSSSASKKLSKEQTADAVELTKFALAALQKGDSELGRERLEQALGVWRSKSKKNGKAGKKLSGRHMEEAVEYTKLTLAALHRGDAEEAKQRLKQALGAWS